MLASRILTQTEISVTDMQLADALLLHFCKRVERMYGKAIITPNMHLHCHLKQCLLDYGPVYGFWLFSFERYNGIMESFPTSNRSVEITLMQRFIREFSLSGFPLPQEYYIDFESILSISESADQGCLRATLKPHNSHLLCLRNVKDWTQSTLSIQLPKCFIRFCFDSNLVAELKSLYTFIYPAIISSHIVVTSTAKKYHSIVYEGVRYNTKAPNSCYVFVQEYSPTLPLVVRPVIVHYFVQHSFHFNEQPYTHILAVVSWLKKHHAKDSLGKPLQVWWKDLFDSGQTLIPLHFFAGPCVHMDISFEDQTVLLVSTVTNLK